MTEHGAAPAAKRRERPARQPLPVGPPPTEARLRDAALAHLARFAATEAGLLRVLRRRVDRWAQRATAEAGTAIDAAATIADAAVAARHAAAAVAKALVASGLVDDAAFAASRARRLTRAGRSRRAIAANLAAKGVPRATAAEALPTDEATELDAALAYCRRRRIGPFAQPPRPGISRTATPTATPTAMPSGTSEAKQRRPIPPEEAARQKALAALARAGFDRATAEAALDLAPAAATARLEAARRG